MKIKMIAAMDQKRGIGKNNDLMWKLSDDMRFFMNTTKGHIVVMGRKNYDSIPEKYRPLADRENVVLTRNKNFKADNCRVFHDMKDCISFYEDKEEKRDLFIIGGGEIYRLALELGVAEEIYLTYVLNTYDADTFFPEFDTCEWNQEFIGVKEKDERNEADFVIVKYTKK